MCTHVRRSISPFKMGRRKQFDKKFIIIFVISTDIFIGGLFLLYRRIYFYKNCKNYNPLKKNQLHNTKNYHLILSKLIK